MTPFALHSTDIAYTQRLAASFAGLLRAGDCVALCGELGAGKTSFVRGLAQGLGVDARQQVHSPTFALLHTYRGRLPLYHFDLYRLKHPGELDDLGLRDYLGGGGGALPAGVAAIEWADRLDLSWPAATYWVRLQHDSANGRRISFEKPADAALAAWYKDWMRGQNA